MLKYFVMTVEALITAAVLVGLIRGYSRLANKKLGGLIASIGTGAGFIGACVMSYMKNATTKIDTSQWNLRIFIASIAVLVLFLIFSPFKKLCRKPGEIIQSVLLGLCSALLVFYALPDVLAYPYNILLTDSTVLSTDFLFKMIGIVLGVIFILLVQMSFNRGVIRLPKLPAFIILALALAANGVRFGMNSVGIMLTKRILNVMEMDRELYHKLFEIAKFSSNNDILFTYIIIGVSVAVPVILWAMSFAANEPYNNPAEKRKIRKKWKVTRRWANLVIITLALGVVNFTVLKPLSNKEIELSPVEKVTDDNGNIYVPFEDVADEHLHRFGYTSPDGTEIRFIVIKKPNSSSYGIGLDACDICGETGYYEKDGQVVCKLCDVVMNINTIGFKGGCNPIVIPYSIENGKIVVPVDGLLEYEKEFK